MDNIEQAIARLLETIPENWKPMSPDGLTATEEKALSQLTAAGLVEQQIDIRVRMMNHPKAARATIVFTGEQGLKESFEKLIAALYTGHGWAAAWEQWHRDYTVCPFQCERTGAQWRLTFEGRRAKEDLKTDPSMVLDFVLKRGLFGKDTPVLTTARILSDGPSTPVGSLFSRPPVAGTGKLCRYVIEDADPPATPPVVNIGNFGPDGQPLSEVLEQCFKKYPGKTQAPKEEKEGERRSAKEDKQDWPPHGGEYITNSEAVKLSDGRLTLAHLNKVLRSGKFGIRYVKNRKGTRCKVHIEDFRNFLNQWKPGVNLFSEEFFRIMEERKNEIRQKNKE